MFDMFLTIILSNLFWSPEKCELNKKVLGALEKSVGFYERNYSLFDFNVFDTFKYLKCTVFYFHLILRYIFYLIKIYISFNFLIYNYQEIRWISQKHEAMAFYFTKSFYSIGLLIKKIYFD